MKNTKFISALLVPAVLTGCSNDIFEENGFESNVTDVELHDVTLMVGLGNSASRGNFATDEEKGVFGKFYFEPEFYTEALLDGSAIVGNLKLTDNANIYGDKVGLCLPNPTVSATGVLTNVPFYIAGYQTAPNDNGTASAPKSLAYNNTFYTITGAVADAFAHKSDFDDAVASIGALSAGEVDVTKGIFKSVSGVMAGDYVLYYPYDPNFKNMGEIPAVELDNIMTQTTFAAIQEATQASMAVTPAPTATNDHVLGQNLFAYSKTPFKVGTVNEAMNMSMAPAAYFFQFKVYASKPLSTSDQVKLITVTTADNAKAFALKGNVQAGTTCKFVADATSAVDMIGVEMATSANIASATTSTNDEIISTASTAYLSTYATDALKGKDIVVSVYTEGDKVYTKTFKGAGSEITEGATDYWFVDLSACEVEDAETLAYDEDTFTEANTQNSTIILKSNIELTKDLVLAAGVTVKGEGYSITNKTGRTLTLADNVNLNTTVVNEGEIQTLEVSDDVYAINKLLNNGTITLKFGTTKVVDFTNNAGGILKIWKTGGLEATTLTNNAAIASPAKAAGLINVNGVIKNTSLYNNGSLCFGDEANIASVSVGLDKTVQITNNSTVDVRNEKTSVLVNGAVITNNKEFNNNGIVTLTGDSKFYNNGIVKDANTFSGLSRLENGEGAEFIRSVTGLVNLTPSLNEENITAINITNGISATTAINTNKTIYLNADLTLPTDANKQSVIGKIVFEGASETLIGNIKTNAIDVKDNGIIGANSNVTVDGDINVAESKTLTGNVNSYTICNDLKGKGKVSGPIYVR